MKNIENMEKRKINIENEKFSRPRSYVSRLIRVCFGSNLRLRWASDWLRPRLAPDKHPSKYTNNVLNIFSNLLNSDLIHVLSVVRILCHFVTLSLCHSVTLSLCYFVTLLLCQSVTLSLCHFVTLLLCTCTSSSAGGI